MRRGIFLENRRQLTIGSKKYCASGLKKRHLAEIFELDILEGRNWP